MIDDILLYASTIRKLFEMLPSDQSLSKEIAEYCNLLRGCIKDQPIDWKKHNAYITLGIAFAIVSLGIKDNSSTYKEKIECVKISLQSLTRGIKEYDNKRWKAECAFWAIFVLCNNELYVNDYLCDTLIRQKKSVTVDNITLLKFNLIEYLARLIGLVDKDEHTFTPLYNELNGLNDEIVNQYHYDWGEPGLALCRKLGLCYGSEYYENQENDAFENFFITLN